MYHRVAKALGLYTQEAKLIAGSRKYHRGAAIPYVPNAKPFDLMTSSEANLKMYIAFEALYVILNENDSHEFYLDEDDKLFKLDNAASFTVEETTIRSLEGDPIGHFFIPDINTPLHSVGYEWYGLVFTDLKKKHGQLAADAFLSLVRKFVEFDATVLKDAYTALYKQYPATLKGYYEKCISIRKLTCQRFLDEMGEAHA
jgi:hypothetical protein